MRLSRGLRAFRLTESQRAESHNEQQRLFEALVDTAPQGVVVHDATRIYFVNRAATRMFGYDSPDELLSLPPPMAISLIAPEDRPLALQHWETLKYSEAADGHLELRCVRRDGSRFAADTLRSSIEWHGRRVALVHLLETARNGGFKPTPLPNERLLQAIFETFPLQLFVKDRDARYVMVNAAFAGFFGVAPLAFIGNKLSEVPGRPLQDAEIAEQQDRLALTSADGVKFYNQEMVNGKGETRWVDGIKLPLKDELGNVVGILGALEDVTERRRTVHQLRESRELMRVVLDTIPYPFFLKDLNGRLLMANTALAKVWKLPVQEVIGKAVHEYTHLDSMPQEEAAAMLQSDARVAGGETLKVEIARGRPGGARIYDCIKAPVRDATGQVSGIVTLARDITEDRKAEKHRAELEAQLQHTQKMELIGQLAAGVAHDFNNLLTPILGHAELLLMSRPPQDPDRAALDVIRQAAERASELTRQLLAFGRKQVLAMRVLSLNEEVAKMLPMLERVLGTGVQVVYEASKPAAHVRADVSQLHQVLMNLVVNARDAMPRGGTVTISAERNFLDADYAAGQPNVAPGNYLRLSVRDTGTGIEPETLKRIFEPFFTTKEPGKGTGLGLAIAYGIVQQHHGHLRVESERGKGSRFDVYLPEAVPEVEPHVSEPASLAPRGTERVLLVDPDVWGRDVMQRVLRNLGYLVNVAGSSDDALSAAAGLESGLSLLVTDLELPNMSGVELYRQLSSAHEQLKVLYVTGNSESSFASLNSGNRNAPLLQKPFPILTFATRVRELLDGQR